MARTVATNFSGALQFPYATAGPDAFKKEDVQTLAYAVDNHDHTTGKGLVLTGAALAWPIVAPNGAQIGAPAGSPNQFTFTATTKFTGNMALGGTAVPAGGAPSLTIGDTGNGGHIYLADAHISNWNAGQVRFYGTAILADGGVQIGSDNTLVFNVNGYSFKGVNGQPLIMTNASFHAAGGSVYLDSGATKRLYWDGSNIRSNIQFYTDGQIVAGSGDIISASGGLHAKGGTLYAGATDQSILQMWNPGEWRVSSSPGNFYAAGVLTAEGGPVTGKGAYVNSASSESLKKNITTLDPDACLSQVLDDRARPVSFEYIEPLPRLHVPQDSPQAPLQPIDWTAERLGFIAEEVARVVPQAAGIVDGTTLAHGLSTEALVPILWGAVRALSQRIQTLEGATV